MDVELAETEPTTTSIVEADDSIYRSCMFCCISIPFERVLREIRFLEFDERIRTFVIYILSISYYFYLLQNLRFGGKVIKPYCYYYLKNKIWNEEFEKNHEKYEQNSYLSLYKNIKRVFIINKKIQFQKNITNNYYENLINKFKKYTWIYYFFITRSNDASYFFFFFKNSFVRTVNNDV